VDRVVALEAHDQLAQEAADVVRAAARDSVKRRGSFVWAPAERHFRSLLDGPPEPHRILLGMGKDGHTASLFPGSAPLLETEILSAASYIDDLTTWRIIATLPLLNSARSVISTVTGTDKAPSAQRVLCPALESIVLPAPLVAPTNGSLTWLLDFEAATLIPHCN
jgi:6-phosphogluconolactonase/glucosamine-6-phosphate isomerase/deaminase